MRVEYYSINRNRIFRNVDKEGAFNISVAKPSLKETIPFGKFTLALGMQVGHLADMVHLLICHAILFLAGLADSMIVVGFQVIIPFFSARHSMQRHVGALSVAEQLPILVAPPLASFLMAHTDLRYIFVIDAATFILAFVTMSLVQFPKDLTQRGMQLPRMRWDGLQKTWSMIVSIRPLQDLLMLFIATNLFNGIAAGVFTAYLLQRLNGSTEALSWVNSLAAVGGVLASIYLIKAKRPPATLGAMLFLLIIAALVGRIALGLATSLAGLAVTTLVRSAVVPIIGSFNQEIWNVRVARDVQGRVFGLRRMVTQVSYPFAVLVGGSLGHSISKGNLLAAPGSGLGLLIIFMGLAECVAIAVIYWRSPSSHVSQEMPYA